MVRHRILEFVDDNGDAHYRCQWKGWFFWHYYKRDNLHCAVPQEFDSIFGVIERIKKERKYKKRFVRSHVFIEKGIYGESCPANSLEKLKEGLDQPCSR